MNEELQKSLAEILQKATSGVEAGAAFLQAELPEVINQLLMWKLVSNGLGAAFFLSAVGFYAWFVYACMKPVEEATWLKSRYGLNEEAGVALVLGGAISISFSVLGVASLMDAIQILVAPKIYLIEYAASLAK